MPFNPVWGCIGSRDVACRVSTIDDTCITFFKKTFQVFKTLKVLAAPKNYKL
jgi:hypothetical protein